jgi:hypothetical protein
MEVILGAEYEWGPSGVTLKASVVDGMLIHTVCFLHVSLIYGMLSRLPKYYTYSKSYIQ